MAYCGLDSHDQLDLHLLLMHLKYLETSLVPRFLGDMQDAWKVKPRLHLSL